MQTEQLDNVIFTFISLMHAFDSIISTSILDLLAGRTKIYAARVSRGNSSYWSIFTARARAQQQTCRPPLLLSIDGTDGRMDGRSVVL